MMKGGGGLNMIKQGTHCTGKTGKMAKKKSMSGKTQGIWKFGQNTGNSACSSCKFHDSKGKDISIFCREKLPKNFEAG